VNLHLLVRFQSIFQESVMQEYELKEYQRLRAEGRWNAASEFREAERKRLRAVGCNRQQAREESWEAMLEKYPPQDGQTPARPSAVALDRWGEADSADSESQLDEHNQDAEFAEELKQLALLTSSQSADVDRDIDFAHRNMSLPTLTPLMEPRLAAWKAFLAKEKLRIQCLIQGAVTQVCTNHRRPTIA